MFRWILTKKCVSGLKIQRHQHCTCSRFFVILFHFFKFLFWTLFHFWLLMKFWREKKTWKSYEKPCNFFKLTPIQHSHLRNNKNSFQPDIIHIREVSLEQLMKFWLGWATPAKWKAVCPFNVPVFSSIFNIFFLPNVTFVLTNSATNLEEQVSFTKSDP